MKQSQRLLPLWLLVFSLLLNCTEQQNSLPGRRAVRRTDASDAQSYLELQRKARELEALQAQTEELQRSLIVKEQLLLQKEAELDSLQDALAEKELELQQREAAAKSIRRTGLGSLLIGVVLIFVALRKSYFSKPAKGAGAGAKSKNTPAKRESQTAEDKPEPQQNDAI